MSVEHSNPISKVPKRPRRVVTLFLIGFLAIVGCIFVATTCGLRQLEEIREQYQFTHSRVRISEIYSQSIKNDLEKALFEIKTLKDKYTLLESEKSKLSAEIKEQKLKISELETKSSEFAKYEMLIHGSMQKNDFAVYNDIYLETFKGLLPIAESLENLSKQLAETNPKAESLEILNDIKTAQAESSQRINTAQEIIKESLGEAVGSSTYSCDDKVTIEAIITSRNTSSTEDTEPNSRQDNTSSNSTTFKEKMLKMQQKVQEGLKAFANLAGSVLNSAKEKAGTLSEDLKEKSKLIGETISDTGKAIKTQGENIVKKGKAAAKKASKKAKEAVSVAIESAKENLTKATEATKDKIVDLGKKTAEMVNAHGPKILDQTVAATKLVGEKAQVAASQAFESAKEAAQVVGQKAEEVGKQVKNLLDQHGSKVVEETVNIAKKAGQGMAKMKNVIGKLFK